MNHLAPTIALLVLAASRPSAAEEAPAPAGAPPRPTAPGGRNGTAIDPGLLGKEGFHPRSRCDAKEEEGLLDKLRLAEETAGRPGGQDPARRRARPGILREARREGGGAGRDPRTLREEQVLLVERCLREGPSMAAHHEEGRRRAGASRAAGDPIWEIAVAVAAVAVLACGSLAWIIKK